MTQPPCDEEGYGECVEQPDPPPAKVEPAHPNALAVTFWLILIIGLALVEYYANRNKQRSPSHFLKRYTGRVLKWIGVIGFTALGWHLFFGGPL